MGSALFSCCARTATYSTVSGDGQEVKAVGSNAGNRRFESCNPDILNEVPINKDIVAALNIIVELIHKAKVDRIMYGYTQKLRESRNIK